MEIFSLRIKFLKNGARDFMEKASAQFEVPGLKNLMYSHEKISARAEKTIDTGVGRYKLPEQLKLSRNFCLGSFPISVSTLVEISHVIRSFFNPVCRAEFQPGLKFSHVISPLFFCLIHFIQRKVDSPCQIRLVENYL